MKKQMSMAFLIVISLTIASNYIGILKPDKLASSQNITISNEVVFSIPIGENGIHYEGSDNPDMLTWGPPAFTIAPDNTFWIADTPDNHILQFNSKGVLLSKIATENFIIGAGDLEVTSSEIWVLDEASLPPKVVRLSLDGKIISIHDLPKGFWLEDGLSGITLGSDGSVIIERIGGHDVTPFISSAGELKRKSLEGYEFQGKLYSAFPADMREKDASKGYILVGENRIDVEVTNDLGDLSILHVNSDYSLYVKVVELVLNKSFQVDLKVYHYDALGNLLGIARVLLAEQFTSVDHGIVVGPDSEVYALITKRNGAEVHRLAFTTELPSVLIPPTEGERNQQLEKASITAETCRERKSIIDVAKEYLNNSTYLSTYHINDNSACTGRVKPSYLGNAGTYSSIPYAWNLWDTVD